MNESEHPNDEDREAFEGAGSQPEPGTAGHRVSTAVWIAVVVIAIVLLGVMVVLHSTGTFGPGTH